MTRHWTRQTADEIASPRAPSGAWDWRSFLTAEERQKIDEIDKAKEVWRKLNKERVQIARRAFARARMAEKTIHQNS